MLQSWTSLSKVAFLTVLILGTVYFSGICQGLQIEPTDNDLKNQFMADRGSFEKLKDMICSDERVSVVSNCRLGSFSLINGEWLNEKGVPVSKVTVHRATAVSPDRWEIYQRLLQTTGTKKLIKLMNSSGNNEVVIFTVWFSHISPKPSLEEKRIIYTRGVIAGNVCSDTTYKRPAMPTDLNKDRKEVTIYSRIEKNWYISFVRFGNLVPDQHVENSKKLPQGGE